MFRNSSLGDYHQFYSEEEILKDGISAYEYDSILEIKELNESDLILKMFKEAKAKSKEINR